MRKNIVSVLTAFIVVGLIVLGLIFSNYSFSENQISTLIILSIICGASVLYCFVVGTLVNNYSQMDKLWSILPIAYVWVVAIRGGMNPRLIIYTVIATLWGIRLTINFGRKGAYKLKFWEGEEDYRRAIVRKNKLLSSPFAWAMFNFFFISLYQNVLVLAMTLPSLAVMESTQPLGVFDFVGFGLALGFLCLETIADEQQWKFHKTKRKLLSEGKKLEELPEPYNLGFNTTGVWAFFRHPNYLGEQGIWMSLYLVVVGSGVANYGIFNWSIVGPLLLILLFMGSSTLGEKISSGKYPKYKDYQEQVCKYLPLRKFTDK